MDIELFKHLGVAILLSTLVGLEREQKYQLNKFKDSFGGVRTFVLIGILGVASYFLSQYSIYFALILGMGFLGLLISSYVMVTKILGKFGATSEMAALVVYSVGILCGMEQYVLATAISLATLSVLHFKKPLHKWAKHLKNEEIISTIEFVLISFVVLPFLPNQGYGPYEFFNPYIIWLMVVFISGLSFLSYIAIKVLGAKKGIGLTGFLAGLISSTALTISFSEQSKRNKRVVNPYVVGLVVACTAMFFRIIVEVLVLNPDLVPGLLIPMLTMGGVGIVSILFFWIRREMLPKGSQDKAADVKSPFRLKPAISFGLLFAFVLFLSKFMHEYMGDRGIYLTSLMSGLADVDAITVSMAKMVNDGMDEKTGIIAITIAAMTNTFVKGGYFFIFGARKVALKIVSVFGLMIFAGAVSLMFI